MKLSVCIPAYNRVEFLSPLLDSIRLQDSPADEIIICEDHSPQREEIAAAATDYQKQYPNFPLRIKLNEENLGYDKNFRSLLNNASGDYCLFMGNDDILLPGAITRIRGAVSQHPDIAVISRAYQWFLNDIGNVQGVARHLDEDRYYEPGLAAVQFFYRRMGVLSGLVFKRLPAVNLATSKYDGFLYYQMHLAGQLLKTHPGYYISTLQTASRDGIAPDFGNAENEKGEFKPGGFAQGSRIHMVDGLLTIARDLDEDDKQAFYQAIRNDIGNYFYPYIRDQLNLPLKTYLRMIVGFKKIGMNNHPMFLLHATLGYLLKKQGYDSLINGIKKILGRSPQIGFK
jgi:abequosyltransferase